jgi:hypothetical protein
MQKKPIFWTTLFIIFLILTQLSNFLDFGTKMSFLGLPYWLFFFVAINFLYVVLLFFFDQYLFKEEEI